MVSCVQARALSQAPLWPQVRGYVDGQAKRKIVRLGDEELIRTLGHAHLRYATLVGDGFVWVHDDTGSAERSLIIFVDHLDCYETLRTADDSDSKTEGPFSVEDPDIRSLAAPDTPRVEAFPRRGFKFHRGNIEAARSGPAVASERPASDLCPLVVVDSKVPVREVALTGALDPDLHPESFTDHNSRWGVPRDDMRGVRFDRERNRRRRLHV